MENFGDGTYLNSIHIYWGCIQNWINNKNVFFNSKLVIVTEIMTFFIQLSANPYKPSPLKLYSCFEYFIYPSPCETNCIKNNHTILALNIVYILESLFQNIWKCCKNTFIYSPTWHKLISLMLYDNLWYFSWKSTPTPKFVIYKEYRKELININW